MYPKISYGKIFAISFSVVASLCTVALVLYRLLHNLIAFCHTYQVPKKPPALAFDEIEETPSAQEIPHTEPPEGNA